MNFSSFRHRHIKGTVPYPPSKKASHTTFSEKQSNIEKLRTGNRDIEENDFLGLRHKIITVPKPKNIYSVIIPEEQ